MRRHMPIADAVPVGCLLLVATLALGCSDDPEPAPTEADTTAAADVADAGPDVSVAGDAAADVQVSCPFAPKPAPGQPGHACTKDADCAMGPCVQQAGEGRCSRPCDGCCPEGWSCNKGDDGTERCTSNLAALCHPCITDAECAAKAVNALCVQRATDQGGGGACGAGCDSDAACPAGYGCVFAQGSHGGGKQCVLSEGSCGCSPLARQLKAQTWCALTNVFGTCKGMRSCGDTGMSGCSAPLPQEEVCNLLDDDCDGLTDDIPVAACEESNAHGVCLGARTCTPTGFVCSAVVPTAEACNGKDDNCDGATDEGYDDIDGDGIADCVDPDQDGDGDLNADDCAPLDKSVGPGAVEVCSGKDNDCDGFTDETGATGCAVWWLDGDQDGFGKSPLLGGDQLCLCAAKLPYTATTATDCDDVDANVNPGAVEVCNDADDDCDGQTDAGCDDDGDGWCDLAMVVIGLPAVCTKGVLDCDDTDGGRNPGAAEVCSNGKDDNCDEVIDGGVDALGCTLWFQDGDGDGQGFGAAQCLCTAAGLYTSVTATDCDDKDAKVHAGAGEICGNGKDDDCDGEQNPVGGQGCSQWWHDADADGYGVGLPLCMCMATVDLSAAKGGDCKDDDKAFNPGVKESCNQLDDDCDGKTDEQGAVGCTTFYVDVDGDGWGDAKQSVCLCGGIKPYTATKTGDCKDDNAAVYPGAAEITCNGIDEDCVGGDDC